MRTAQRPSVRISGSGGVRSKFRGWYCSLPSQIPYVCWVKASWHKVNDACICNAFQEPISKAIGRPARHSTDHAGERVGYSARLRVGSDRHVAAGARKVGGGIEAGQRNQFGPGPALALRLDRGRHWQLVVVGPTQAFRKGANRPLRQARHRSWQLPPRHPVRFPG